MKWTERILFGAILALALALALFLGFINDRFALTDLSDDVGLSGYPLVALDILHRFSFHGETNLYEHVIRRPPGYPIAIATSFLLFGESLYSIWIMHAILWLASLTLLWRISKRFLKGKAALLPPFFFGCWWAAAAQMFVVNAEIAAWFFFLLFVWAFIRYQEERRVFYALLFGGAFGWFVLIKPVFLYAAPFLFFFFIWQNRLFSPRFLRDSVIALLLFVTPVSAWSLYSHRLLGTYQLASGGLTVMRRADDVLLSPDRFRAFFIASIAGDYIADQFFPGYADDPEPMNAATYARERLYEQRLLPDKSNEVILQKQLSVEATSLIKQSPLKFIFTSAIYFFRLHAPLNYTGAEIDRLFVGTHPAFSPAQKIAILIGIRIAWYLFIAMVAISAIKRLRGKDPRWYPFFFLILFTNGAYALLSHAEPRYLFPVMPLYFLLFALLLIDIKTILLRAVPDSRIENRASYARVPTTRDL